MNETKTKRTPTPWTIDKYHSAIISDSVNYCICNMTIGVDDITSANARLIVTACNHFDEMLDLLKQATFTVEHSIEKDIHDLLDKIKKEEGKC